MHGKIGISHAGWPLALIAIFCAQTGSVISKKIMSYIGPETTAWMRVTVGAIILLLVVRPKVRGITAQQWWLLTRLGFASAFMSLFFLAGIERIPLGLGLAVEYLGPLTLAAITSRNRTLLIWPAMALSGVILVTQPWKGVPDLTGIVLVSLAGVFWAFYIVLTQRAGDLIDGRQALALSVPICALVTAIPGIPSGASQLTPPIIAACIGLGLLHPVLTFGLEMRALHRMTPAAFGTLAALSPAFASFLASLALKENLSVGQWGGIFIVVIAGIFSQRDGERIATDGKALKNTVQHVLREEKHSNQSKLDDEIP